MQLSNAKLILGILLLVTGPAHALEEGKSELSTDRQKREYLQTILYSREAVDDWLAGKVQWGEVYHPILGWVHNERTIHHGVDGSYVSYHYDPDGARRLIAYAGRPCRINSYGNSFTSCEQVNDGETWQEYLAAHLQEPIRNFGTGGYSVYQSYRRMLLQEPVAPAPYIIFNILDDDHYRNLTGWRNIRLGFTPAVRTGVSLPTLPYVKANPATNQFIEYENACPTPDSAYGLCDIDWVFDQFKDDLTLNLVIARRNIEAGTPDKSYAEIGALADEYALKMKIDSPESLQEAVDAIETSAALYASMQIVKKVEEYAAKHQKKVLYVLSYTEGAFREVQRTSRRFDQSFLDFLNAEKLPFVDLMRGHLEDFAQRKIDSKTYGKHYWIGHYNPRGNYFTAFAMKDPLVKMLDPKPLSYNPAGKVTLETPWESGSHKIGD